MDYTTLLALVDDCHALSFQADLVPVDALPDATHFRVSPPTYAGERNGDPARYLISEQGEVRLDSPQSFANRLEERILDAKLTPSFQVVHPEGKKVLLDSRHLAHRCFDAYLRDSSLEGVPFFRSEIGQALRADGVGPGRKRATTVFKYSPETLIFGGWDSHTGGGALSARWRRCVSARIFGTNAHQRPGGSQKTDPLGLTLDAGAPYKTPDGQMTFDETLAAKDGKGKPLGWSKLTEAGYGSVPNSGPDGVDVERIVLQGAIHLGELRKYVFPTEQGEAATRDRAARAALAGLALWSVQATVTESLALRSGCELTYTQMRWTARYGGGRDETLPIQTDVALETLQTAIAALAEFGLGWDRTPVQLEASAGILEAIRLSAGD